LQARIGEHVARARALAEKRNWSEAESELGTALARDPLNPEVLALRDRVARERGHARAMEQAAALIARGGADDLAAARALYARIPVESVYHDEAAQKAEELERGLPDHLVREAESACDRRDTTRCRSLLCAAPAGMTEIARLKRKFGVSCP
jgi:hypothetical protein